MCYDHFKSAMLHINKQDAAGAEFTNTPVRVLKITSMRRQTWNIKWRVYIYNAGELLNPRCLRESTEQEGGGGNV